MWPSVSLPPGGLLPLSRGRFPMSGGNGRRPKGVGMMSRSDRGDRDRCPNAHTGADEVRPSKPPVPSTDHRNRAARCTAPTGWSGFPSAGDRKGRPYGFTGALPEIWRAGEDTRPYTDAEALSSIRRGRTLAGPQMCAARPGGRALQPSTSRHLLVKARRGTETASAPIFHHARAQWPGGNLDTHSDFHAPEILHIPTGTRPPVMGSGERRI